MAEADAENKIHVLKIWPEFYLQMRLGDKNFELRKNDRDYKVLDTIILREYRPGDGIYTGRILQTTIKYILHADGFAAGLKPGYVILALTQPNLVREEDYRELFDAAAIKEDVKWQERESKITRCQAGRKWTKLSGTLVRSRERSWQQKMPATKR